MNLSEPDNTVTNMCKNVSKKDRQTNNGEMIKIVAPHS
jgi:hypothetical protein